ncbi:endolytic transglycosylase MltG [Alphaproteobacteria bacterium LSUCC0719]
MLRSAARLMIRTVGLLGLLTALVAGGWFVVDRMIVQADGPHQDSVLIQISPGDGHATIRWALKRGGVIRDLYHYDAARIMAGTSFVPKEGEFEIPPRASLAVIMDIIHAGRSYQRRFTVIEGMTSADIASVLRENENFSGEITVPMEEGSLLPETYFYTRGTSRDAMLARMQEKRELALAEAWIDRSPDLPYESPRDALILASIIELETADSAERLEVAGVFVNRLKRGMRLQSDPTVLYGVETGANRPIRKSDLKRRTEWNTYVIKGLPKTPICNPSLESINAALAPAQTRNLYFVSDGKGGLRFARTLDEHNRNVRLFREAQRKAGLRDD